MLRFNLALMSHFTQKCIKVNCKTEDYIPCTYLHTNKTYFTYLNSYESWISSAYELSPIKNWFLSLFKKLPIHFSIKFELIKFGK